MIMENLSKLKKCGYYIVKWTSDSYTFQSPHKMVKYIIKAGELVCDVVYFNPLANFKQWYNPYKKTHKGKNCQTE